MELLNKKNKYGNVYASSFRTPKSGGISAVPSTPEQAPAVNEPMGDTPSPAHEDPARKPSLPDKKHDNRDREELPHKRQ